MGRGNRRRKRGGPVNSSKNKGRASVKDHVPHGEGATDLLAEEITALSAIFEEDFKLVCETPSPQLSITVRPYSMDNGLNDSNVSVELLVRCLPGYPYKVPKLQIIPDGGLSEEDLHHLHSMLLDQANSKAREGRVMVYNLVEATQEFLSEIIPNNQTHSQNSKVECSLVATNDGWMSESAKISGEDTFFTGGSEVYGVIDLFSDLWVEGGTSWETGMETGGALHVGSSKGSVLSQGMANRFERGTRKNSLVSDFPGPLKNATVKDTVPEKPFLQKGTQPMLQARNLTSMLTHATGKLEVLKEESEGDIKDLPAKAFSTTSVSEFLQKIRSGLIRVGRAMRVRVALVMSYYVKINWMVVTMQ